LFHPSTAGSLSGTTYDNADKLASTTTPVPGTGVPAQITPTLYDNMGRTAGILNPDYTTVAMIYSKFPVKFSITHKFCCPTGNPSGCR